VSRMEANLWDYLAVIIKWRRVIIANFLIVAVIVAVISLFLPPWYEARTTILPPERESGSLGLSAGLLGGLGATFLGGGGMALPTFATLSDVYAAILKSRRVAERVVEINNLMELFDTESMTTALETLKSHLSVTVGKEGIITLAYEDKDPVRAAQVTNSFVEQLNTVNQEVNISKAKSTREFIEERLRQTKEDLRTAEENYKQFQEKHRAISLDDQVRAQISYAAQLEGELVMAEIELGVLRKTLSNSHQEVRQQRARIEEIKKQLRILDQGGQGSNPEAAIGTKIPFSEAPTLGLELARFARELEVQGTVFEMLTQQYEQAKIQENKDTPTVNVLDRAYPPEERVRPARAQLVALAGAISIFITILAVFFVEYLYRVKREKPETWERISGMTASLKGDLS
jgi:tyrosine-protein kinase Etk/Wzc